MILVFTLFGFLMGVLAGQWLMEYAERTGRRDARERR